MRSSTRGETALPASVDAAAWLTPGRFAVLLAALEFAAFPTLVTGQRTLFFGDYGLFGYPLAYYHSQSFRHGEMPLWNPLSDFGLPHLAQWNTLTCYPLSLVYLLLPLPWSLGIFCLGHLFLAGLGMYFLAHALTGSRAGAAVAGTAFAFGGLGMHCLIWPNNMAALGWMPWVIHTARQALLRGGRATASAAVVGAMQMLAGAPEIILFTWATGLVLFANDWLEHPGRRAAMVRRLAGLAVWVTMLAAIQLLPFLDLLGHSHRQAAQGRADSSMPATGWANFLVPLFHCYKSPPGLFFQPGQWWTDTYYISLGPLALALVSILRGGERCARLLAVLSGLCLVLALGDQAHLYAWLRRLFPPINLVNFPVKFVVPVTFGVPLLGAFGIARATGGAAGSWAGRFRPVLGAGVLLIGAMAVILGYACLHPKPYEEWPSLWKNALARALFLVLTLATLAASCRAAARRARVLWMLCVPGLIWADGLTHLPHQNPTAPPDILRPRMPVLQRLDPLPRPGGSRVMLSAAAVKEFQRALLPDLGNTYLGHRLGLYFNCNLLEDIPKAGGFYSLYLPGQVDILFALYATTNGLAAALADFTGVSHISSAANPLEWTARSGWLPLATAGQEPVFADPTNTLTSMIEPGFLPRERVYLPLEARALLGTAGRGRTAVEVTRFQAHRIELNVQGERAALVVLSQSFYHCWRASVDGRPARLWLANGAFQALEVGPGTHRVVLAYEDPMFRAGAGLSVLAAALAIAQRRRRPAGKEER